MLSGSLLVDASAFIRLTGIPLVVLWSVVLRIGATSGSVRLHRQRTESQDRDVVSQVCNLIGMHEVALIVIL
jgi:hypothetical protein